MYGECIYSYIREHRVAQRFGCGRRSYVGVFKEIIQKEGSKMEKLVYWIWLSLACTPDSSTFPSLLDKFTDAEEVYRADEADLRGVIDRRATDRHALLDKNLDRAKEILDFCRSKRVGIVTYADPTYPDSLREITSPPVLLYYRGVWQDFNSGAFYSAIVGTRSVSDYGRKNTFVIARDLARAGAIIVSGMAIGIDGVALAGALSVEAPTVAVIGSGIDVCYPAQHVTLAREIVKRGCVITEFAPGTPPNKYNFPKRNRIISGLAAATLVMEGREKSGALITARCAKEQGRAVYALPGNVGSPTSEVTNLLLKNGAKALVSADDVVRDFELQYHGRLNPFKLAEKTEFNMALTLSSLKVAATAPSDDIFFSKPPRDRISYAASESQIVEDNEPEHPTESDAEPKKEAPLPDFDKQTLALYKKIPTDGVIHIESLVDENNDLRSIMKQLLKLEMGHFIVMLPGEQVKRNL